MLLFEVFPDVTICKTYQMNSLYSDTMNWSKYYSETKARYYRWPLETTRALFPNVTPPLYGSIWQILLSKDGYYASLPLNISTIENEETLNNPFVTYCYTTDWNSFRDWNCLDAVRLRWDPMYYKCITIEIPADRREV